MSIPQSPMRLIRSFVRREGRMSMRQSQALETMWDRYGLVLAAGWVDLAKTFGRQGNTILEIGFGMGQSLLAMAKAAPETNFIGIEVHRPGMGALLADMEEQGISNIRVFCADAKDVLRECIADNQLDAVHIFFPDPWPKKRHHKRRLIQSSFIELVQSKLKPHGYLHLATDWQDYAMQMMRVVSAVKGLVNSYGDGQFAPRPSNRPLTKYEQRGQQFGHTVSDLIFVKAE